MRGRPTHFSEPRPLAADTLQYRLRQVSAGGNELVTRTYGADLGDPDSGTTFELVSPNPTRGRVVFLYAVEYSSEARTAIYNVLGQEVTEVFIDIWIAGERYVAQLDLSNYASGLYLARLETYDNMAVQRIVLVR